MQDSTSTLASNSQHDSAAQTTDQNDTRASADTATPPFSQEALRRAVEETRRENLESIKPREAIDLYLRDRSQELRGSTLKTQRSALRFFARWCDQNDIDDLTTLSGRDLQKYRVWRREAGTVKVDRLSKSSEKTQQKILRQFIAYCESIEAVSPFLETKVRIPIVADDEARRDDVLEDQRMRDILQWLRKYLPATIQHVTLELLASTGARIGTLVALDVDDYHPDADIPHLEIRHRPETKLKNGPSAERLVALNEHAVEAINDYLKVNRPDVTDPGDREPLLATENGRIARSTIRTYVYRVTRPCTVGKRCPHDSDPHTCEAMESHTASKCPSSRSPHTIRRAYITHELASGVDPSVVGDKCSVSNEVIEAHYDSRDERQRMEVRQQALKAARQNTQSYGGT